MTQEIIQIMPVRIRSGIKTYIDSKTDIEEIRVRIGQPLELRCKNENIWLNEIITTDDLEEMLTFISRYSRYAYEEEIRQGYLTIEGGNRIGFAGQIRMTEGQVLCMTNIRFLNIRIAREQIGCAKELMPWIYEGSDVLNTLLISKPGVGKTTFLRDCVRIISNGENGKEGKKVCVVDERSEIAACHMGIPQNNLGRRTDVLDGCLKVVGMEMALRSMSPDVIAVDELGGEKDAQAVEKMMLCGCRILGTLHGDNMEQIIKKSDVEALLKKRLFQRYIFLTKQENGSRKFSVYDQECNRLC